MKRRSVIALLAAAALLTGCSSGGNSVEGSAVLTGSAGSVGSVGSVGSASPASSAEHGTPGASGAGVSVPDSSAASADSGGSGGSAGSAGSAGLVSSLIQRLLLRLCLPPRLQLLHRSTPQMSRPQTTTPPPTSEELRAVTAAWRCRKGKYSRTQKWRRLTALQIAPGRQTR